MVFYATEICHLCIYIFLTTNAYFGPNLTVFGTKRLRRYQDGNTQRAPSPGDEGTFVSVSVSGLTTNAAVEGKCLTTRLGCGAAKLLRISFKVVHCQCLTESTALLREPVKNVLADFVR